MKKFLPLLFAVILLLSVGCGKDEPEPVEEAAAVEESVAPTAAPSAGDFDSFRISLVGAENTEDRDGGAVLRIFYDFTNLSDETCSASDMLIASAYQDGQHLNETEAAFLSEYAGNRSIRLQKGASLRCVLEYALVGSGPVSITLDDYNGHAVSAEYDPTALPRLLSESQDSEPETPVLPEGTKAEADLFDLYHAKLNATVVSENDLRVFIEYENVSDDIDAALGTYCVVYAYQDGVELELIDEDKLYTEVAKGSSIVITLDFKLRSDSPVEVDLCENRERSVLAALIVEE